MRYISLFSGIGGFDLGFDRAGMTCVAQVENDPYCIGVLERHWPSVQRIKDVRDAGRDNLPAADLVCGGFPCQDVSITGERAGLDGKRSTLWSEFYRIICEIRPRWVVIENVVGLLSANGGEFFTKILRELSEAGYDAEWDTIPACAFGAPHTRERVFIIAYATALGLEGGLERGAPAAYELLKERDAWHGTGNPFEDIPKLLASPGIGTLFDGIPSTVAIRPELRVYGNAVTPPVAEFIGRCILAAEEEK